jgi:hypothetical protein
MAGANTLEFPVYIHPPKPVLNGGEVLVGLEAAPLGEIAVLAGMEMEPAA